jgi:hypothetical protein
MVTAIRAMSQAMPSIAMGLTTVSLGERANDVVVSLSREYTVTVVDSKTPKKEEWLISPMGDKQKMPVATLYAQNGRVVGFDNTVAMDDEASAQNAFNDLFQLVDKLTKESRNRCLLTSGTNYLNGPLPINKAFIDFTCGPYDFYILRNEFHDTSGELVNGFMLVEKIGDTN